MRAPHHGLLLTAATLVAGCGPASERTEAPAQPPGWDAELRLAEAVDLDPDPAVVEIDLEARVAPVDFLAVAPTEAWTYDGSVPGPLLRATAGDRVIVHFHNALPEPTTMHWHGLRIPASMDGAPGTSQAEIAPGETFDYDFVVPDAGTYWYHPHVRSAAQVGSGLYGPLVIAPAEGEPEGVGDELVLVLSDVSLDGDAQLQPPDVSGDTATLFGREGNTMLVNGRVLPTLQARAGLPQRWRLVNAAKSRYFQLELADHRFTRIGGDGGVIEHPVQTERLLLTPGERADVVVVPRGAPGTDLELRWLPYDRGYGTADFREPEPIIRIRLGSEEEAETPPLPALSRVIPPLELAGATEVALELTRNDAGASFALGINGVPSWEAEPLHAVVGETQIWTVKNTIDWAHPFHLHGFFFQVLEEPSGFRAPLEWKDTVDVPVDTTVRFAVRYDDRPGMWMFHCHILDHADAGMMGMLMLGPD
jgi:FtsP/CotA-like multicopper oxidase with cupredoxin domain